MGAVTLLAGAGFLGGAQLAFQSGTIVDVTAPLLALVLGAFGAIAWSEFAERRVRTRVSRDNELLEQRVRERTADLADAEREIAHRLGVAVEWRDAETGVHIERMGRLCERARARGRAQRRRDRAAAPRERAPRRREGRNPRRDPLEAGQA